MHQIRCPGDHDLWMSGYLDGCGDIILDTDTRLFLTALFAARCVMGP
ncbi:hypothetical protein BH11MYX1_BH11MYX1_50950 [soil metagenome]